MYYKNLTLIAVVSIAAAATYATAQTKPAPAPQAPAAQRAARCEHGACGAGCPMHQVHQIGALAVEETPQGAIVRITAKRTEDVARVRELARKLIDMGQADCQGNCMHPGHGPHHGMRH